LARDLPVMQDVVLLAAASVLVFNVAGDLLLAAIDPRISYG
jgi:ABC-type dipeptide/oligopeptide/nickel transport system permease component